MKLVSESQLLILRLQFKCVAGILFVIHVTFHFFLIDLFSIICWQFAEVKYAAIKYNHRTVCYSKIVMWCYNRLWAYCYSQVCSSQRTSL